MITLILLFCITIVQNASFTLVSRARNSGSYTYNAFASIFSNGIWFVVVQQVVAKPNDVWTGVSYVAGATIGSVLMQWVAINYLEKKKPAFIMPKDPDDTIEIKVHKSKEEKKEKSLYTGFKSMHGEL
jgi:hypothetical protein